MVCSPLLKSISNLISSIFLNYSNIISRLYPSFISILRVFYNISLYLLDTILHREHYMPLREQSISS